MMVWVHALLGAALGKLCRNSPQALLVGALSHMGADMLPHRDLDLPTEAALAAGTLGLVAAAAGPRSREFAGAVGATLPDLENLVGRALRLPDERLLLPTHRCCHGREVRSLLPQVALALACAAVLLLPGLACCAPDRERGISS